MLATGGQFVRDRRPPASATIGPTRIVDVPRGTVPISRRVPARKCLNQEMNEGEDISKFYFVLNDQLCSVQCSTWNSPYSPCFLSDLLDR
jgi:hypothetical protein